MNSILILILCPLIASILIFLIRKDSIRNTAIRVFAVLIGILSIFVVYRYFNRGITLSLSYEHLIDTIITVIEIIIALYIIFIGIKNKKYLVMIFTLIQTPLMLWFDFSMKHQIKVQHSILFDKLTGIMILVVGVVGSLICIYAVGYMKWYHVHHDGYPERKRFFFGVVFLFLAAMFGIVISNDITWMYFCWELTTLCSFLLIGYTKTEKAKNNSFKALSMNLLGGLAFVIAIILIGYYYNTVELNVIIKLQPQITILIPIFLFGIAAITKSAQFPFSSWLLGAMVAPTPSSALLHSATMVKAGVYLIIRISPLLGQTIPGRMITTIGGITFLIASFIAITKSDAKKVLAYSTIANLGLIVACASIGTQESLWAAILLIIFHAISKSLLFLTVGSTEHQLGSRNVEDMDVLLDVSRRLTLYMIIGIAGMFLAPFGMLISKWVAMKAFIDADHIIIVIVLVYGSAATLFYWTKWLGKLVSHANKKDLSPHTFHLDEELPIFIQSVLTVLACFGFPLISKYALIPYLTNVFGKQALIPISTNDEILMIIMLSMLLILPLSFIPIYRSDKRRQVPIYMAGENTGDNETFYGAVGETRKVELRNWYIEDIFGSSKLTKWGNIISIAFIGVGFFMLFWGIL